MKIVNSMSKGEFNGHKVCEALGDPTRTEIFRHLVGAYPKAQTISEIERALSRHISATTISFHLRKLREAGLITTDGHKKGFRAVRRAFIITFSDDGFHVESVK